MLFWHGQPDHYWSSAGDMYPLPPSGVLRDPPVLPYLKQEEPNGISTSQPEFPAFQYILCAPTSPAVRHHEETLTYLNQGQSYEIRMVGTPRGDPAEGRRMVKVSRGGDPQDGEGRGEARGRAPGCSPGSAVPEPPDPGSRGSLGRPHPPAQPKGADRKLKTDREKVEKQPPPEREKFQPSYESTVLAECAPWPDALGAPHSPPGTPGLPTPHPFKLLSPERGCASPACAAEGPAESPGEALSPCASPLETQQWLLRRRFSACARVFANFTGADLLKLSRRDLIQICGAPDGIRLCHALAGRCPRPRLTLYVAREPGGAEGAEDGGSGLYQELHLEQLTVAELTGKLAELLGLPPGQILRVSRQGPSGIHVLVSDAMLRTLQDETSFVVAIAKAPGPEGFELLLR
ncbi:PREDICTED: transcription factor CP2-like protein 1 [Lepidothrix coronata]|uniref:Transcription factor CP2-like protein 1 n=1 Tax=Lepidothrix coronata TaxID=321398 RepID=A0A6J0J4V6_9PASS|nr:PREDICTED: transcription factor CP2-like protein 1 [Lepidothrix coronata]